MMKSKLKSTPYISAFTLNIHMFVRLSLRFLSSWLAINKWHKAHAAYRHEQRFNEHQTSRIPHRPTVVSREGSVGKRNQY